MFWLNLEKKLEVNVKEAEIIRGRLTGVKVIGLGRTVAISAGRHGLSGLVAGHLAGQLLHLLRQLVLVLVWHGQFRLRTEENK